jgi:hypothetical protein
VFVWPWRVTVPPVARWAAYVSEIVAALAPCAVAELNGSMRTLKGTLDPAGLPIAQFTGKDVGGFEGLWTVTSATMR